MPVPGRGRGAGRPPQRDRRLLAPTFLAAQNGLLGESQRFRPPGQHQRVAALHHDRITDRGGPAIVPAQTDHAHTHGVQRHVAQRAAGGLGAQGQRQRGQPFVVQFVSDGARFEATGNDGESITVLFR